MAKIVEVKEKEKQKIEVGDVVKGGMSEHHYIVFQQDDGWYNALDLVSNTTLNKRGYYSLEDVDFLSSFVPGFLIKSNQITIQLGGESK